MLPSNQHSYTAHSNPDYTSAICILQAQAHSLNLQTQTLHFTPKKQTHSPPHLAWLQVPNPSLLSLLFNSHIDFVPTSHPNGSTFLSLSSNLLMFTSTPMELERTSPTPPNPTFLFDSNSDHTYTKFESHALETHLPRVSLSLPLPLLPCRSESELLQKPAPSWASDLNSKWSSTFSHPIEREL